MRLWRRRFLPPASAAALVLLLAGCASEPQPRSSGNRAREQLEAALAEPMDFGQDWDRSNTSLADPLAAAGAGPAAAPAGPVWGIVLKTFSGDNHQQAAATMVSQLPRVSPELSSSRVQTTQRGSLVAYGEYAGPDDPAAQRDLQWVKEINIGGRLVFPRAMLARLNRGSGAAAASPYQLMSVRQRYPNVDPLYTLQVGVWGAFGGALAYDKAQQQAETDVQRLRGEGLPAYVHHDPDAQLSMVTIGLFDHRALNPRSGLFSSEVEGLLRRFPEHLVNGQPVKNPATGESQRPNLVLVPER